MTHRAPPNRPRAAGRGGGARSDRRTAGLDMRLSAELLDALRGRDVALRRSSSARRLSLTVSRIDGRVTVTAPLRCSIGQVVAFVEDHGQWLRTVTAKSLAPISFDQGQTIPILGANYRITRGKSPGVQVERDDGETPGRLVVGARAEDVGVKVETFLKQTARRLLHERSQIHAGALNVTYSRITIRDTRSRWGSCSARGALSYSWRLVMAPLDVLDYVAAHEVAHLVELNHSDRFWALVDKLRPDWRDQRNWLRSHGLELHRYRAAA